MTCSLFRHAITQASTANGNVLTAENEGGDRRVNFNPIGVTQTFAKLHASGHVRSSQTRNAKTALVFPQGARRNRIAAGQ